MKIPKPLISWGLLGIFLAGGAAAITSAPKTVESFLPIVTTINPEKTTYSESVNGIGLIAAPEAEGKKRWLVQVTINESDISNVTTGQKAKLSGAAFPSDYYTAAVSEISDIARQTNTGTTIETIVDVVLEIENPDENLRPGYTVKAEIDTGAPREILIVPYKVIAQDDLGEYVYVLKNHRAVRRDIVTGAELEKGVELISGVLEGDNIILNPDSVNKDALVKMEEEE